MATKTPGGRLCRPRLPFVADGAGEWSALVVAVGPLVGAQVAGLGEPAATRATLERLQSGVPPQVHRQVAPPLRTTRQGDWLQFLLQLQSGYL